MNKLFIIANQQDFYPLHFQVPFRFFQVQLTIAQVILVREKKLKQNPPDFKEHVPHNWEFQSYPSLLIQLHQEHCKDA